MTLLLGDCLEVMAGMEAGSVDAIVCDPPYGLEFMGKEWDKLGDVPRAKIRGCSARDLERAAEQDGLTARRRNKPEGYVAGLPMQEWHQAWATEALRVLKPSHYLLAFGGTRTWHRLACALEDAGFEIRDTLMWLYGSGFPKGKACLKPAWEPIILARKPGPMRALGIEECRVGIGERVQSGAGDACGVWFGGKEDSYELGTGRQYHNSGRYPANLILDEEGDEEWRRYFYCAKASRSERNAGCEGMDAVLCQTGCGGDMPTDDKGHDRDRFKTTQQNHHPTVKPLALMRWLVKLVAYPGDLVLDPFAGSGSTGVACAMEGREFIGIEREAEYLEIAKRRIEAAGAQMQMMFS